MFRAARRCSTAPYSPGLLKFLFTSAMFFGSIDSIPMKIQRPPESDIRSTSSSSRSRLAQLCVGRDDCPQQRLNSLNVDRQVVINKENANLTAVATGARFQAQQLIDHT